MTNSTHLFLSKLLPSFHPLTSWCSFLGLGDPSQFYDLSQGISLSQPQSKSAINVKISIALSWFFFFIIIYFLIPKFETTTYNSGFQVASIVPKQKNQRFDQSINFSAGIKHSNTRSFPPSPYFQFSDE